MVCCGREKVMRKWKGKEKVKEQRARREEGESEGKGIERSRSGGRRRRNERGRKEEREWEGDREEEGVAGASPLLFLPGPLADVGQHKEVGATAGIAPGRLPAPGAAALRRREAGGLQTPQGCLWKRTEEHGAFSVCAGVEKGKEEVEGEKEG